MGQFCSKAQYELVRRFDENAWNNWDRHFARQFYDIDGVLGKGAFSEVVAATQRDNGRRVALKVVFLDNPRLTDNHAAVLRDEVAIIQSLRHPNIVTFDCVMEDPVRRQFVIAEEILLGGTLTEELGAAAANNDDRLLAHVFKQLLSALAHMHEAGVVHRDLKPENVMFRSQAQEWAERGALPVIIDFGMSTRYHPAGAAVVGLLGSPGFVAPEVIEGKDHTPALDMFALGVILYICIAGGRPMTPKQANTLTYADLDAWEFPNMPEDALWQSANARARSLVLRMLERNPANRITARQALHHPWVTADMLTPRPLSVRGDGEAVATERRLRLTAERRQANVEEMLRYMVMALREREQAGQPDKPEADGQLPASGGTQSTAPHPALTSYSAPQAGSATSFFQWMQQHLDDSGPAALPSQTRDTAADADTDAADTAAAAAAEIAEAPRPLLRDVRSRSDITRDAATSRSAAATVAAAWLHGTQTAAASTSPADLLVQSHLHRHLSLAQRSMQSPKAPRSQPTSPPGVAAATSLAAHVPSALPDLDARPQQTRHPRSQTMPVHRDAAFLPEPSPRERATDAAPLQSSSASSSLSSPRHSAPGTEPVRHRPSVRFADAASSADTAGDDGTDASGVAPVHSRTSSGVDPFPLYTQAKGNRLYSVVLAATRRAARRREHAGSAHTSSPASGGSPFSDVSSVVAADKAVGLEEIGAMAQVEWGLRRWRQLAKRVKPAEPASGRRAAVEHVLPEEVRCARAFAELALRFRGVNM